MMILIIIITCYCCFAVDVLPSILPPSINS